MEHLTNYKREKQEMDETEGEIMVKTKEQIQLKNRTELVQNCERNKSWRQQQSRTFT